MIFPKVTGMIFWAPAVAPPKVGAPVTACFVCMWLGLPRHFRSAGGGFTCRRRPQGKCTGIPSPHITAPAGAIILVCRHGEHPKGMCGHLSHQRRDETWWKSHRFPSVRDRHVATLLAMTVCRRIIAFDEIFPKSRQGWKRK